MAVISTRAGLKRNHNRKSPVKSGKTNLFLLPALIAGLLAPLLAGRVAAQTFTTLHSFTGSDGDFPGVELILAGNILYGTTSDGGTNGLGTLFAVNSDGTGFTNLHVFTGSHGDGDSPEAGLILSGSTLYGTTDYGGTGRNGVVFAIDTDGTGLTNVYGFTGGGDGNLPLGGVVLSGSTLYGTTEFGGNGGDGSGTVFAVNTDGTGFTNLYSFTVTHNTRSDGLGADTNSDGADPVAGLILSSNTLYGTTSDGGTGGNGTVFAVNTDGSVFTNLHSFTPWSGPEDTNSDGAIPVAGLILSGSTLYGTTEAGGTAGNGTVFAMNADGSGFTTLHSFSGGSDGASPVAGLILSGSTLYGTSSGGGVASEISGTVFAVNTDGTDFRILFSFPLPNYDSALDIETNSDGAGPGWLILSGYTFYGTAANGGSAGAGTVFSLSFAPQLTITLSGTNLVLTWPTNVDGFDYSGFTLQSTTSLVSPAVWKSVPPAPILLNGRYTVTNPISGGQQFYRLSLLAIPADLALIPAGTFTMGNSSGDGDITDANPTNVTVSAFYMDMNLVTFDQWQAVYSYATNNRYSFFNAGAGKASNHPVQSVDWYDAVKWCNARSQREGLVPVYFTDAGFTQVYTNGDSGTTVYADWGAKGYRLPTEAEWEKAARGGLSGQRFPWGNTLSEAEANYFGCPIGCGFSYDLGPYGYNTNFNSGAFPYTSPAGYFAANGYGLYDMAGNVLEWCWDWYAAPPFPAGSPYLGGSDPRGPASGSFRVLRGGYWDYYASASRCASRSNVGEPNSFNDITGFRCMRAR